MRLQTEHEGTGEVTQLLVAARGGDQAAAERILPLVYEDLRRLARRHLRREMGERTIQATDLVHEAYLKFAGGALGAADRSHFLALASHAMRQVLVDHARSRLAAKRGGGVRAVTFTESVWTADFAPEELLALDAALGKLEERQRRVVECRFFAGMEEKEIADALGVTERTVRRDWAKARAWLVRWMSDSPPD